MKKELDIAIRMKAYEIDRRLDAEQPIIIRVDGRAFHTFTRKMEKPFDSSLRSAFIVASDRISKTLQGMRTYYHQSDEVSFLLMKGRPESQILFDGRVDKINSVVASLFTDAFPIEYATFDCRCFNVPAVDVPNYFYWRVMDARRNSINSVAQSRFSHKELNGKNISSTLEMINKTNPKWEEYPGWAKFGTLFGFPDMNLDNVKACINFAMLPE